MKSLRQLFLEAIPISMYRDEIFKKISKDYKDRYKDWFDDEWRIFLPIEGEELTQLEIEINTALGNYNLKITDWEGGYCNYIKNPKPQDKRIGGVLQNLIKKNLDSDFDYVSLFNQFNNRGKGKSFAKSGRKLCVISRHPYDIAGQSYDRKKYVKDDKTVSHLHGYILTRDEERERDDLLDKGYQQKGWTSCKHLTSGNNKKYIVSEIDDGCLVVYCIWESDYKNKKEDALKTPISRYLLVPVVNENDEDDTALYISDIHYGNSVKGFKETIESWLEDKQGYIDFEEYCVDEDRVYTGDVSGSIKIKTNMNKYIKLFKDKEWEVKYNDITNIFTATITNTYALDKLLPTNYNKISHIYDDYPDYGSPEDYRWYDNLKQSLIYILKIDIDFLKDFYKKVTTKTYNVDIDIEDFVESLQDYDSDIADELADWYHEEESKLLVYEIKQSIQSEFDRTDFLTFDSHSHEIVFKTYTKEDVADVIQEEDIYSDLNTYISNYGITYDSIRQHALENVDSVDNDELKDFISNDIL